MNATILVDHQHLRVETCGDDYPGDLLLTQIDHSGNEACIQIHSSQLRLVAEKLAPAPDRMTTSIQRRLLELQSDLRYFTDPEMWIDEIAERLGDGLAFQIGANAMRHAIDNVIADLGLVPLDEPQPEPKPVEPLKQTKFKTQAPPKSYQQGDLLMPESTG